MSGQIKDGGVVDVRRVMERSSHMHWEHGDNADAEDAEAALAAVAELVEASDCFTCAIAEDSTYRDDLLSAIRELERDSFIEQLNRVRAALARCGGAK